jgi:hypothetical protein
MKTGRWIETPTSQPLVRISKYMPNTEGSKKYLILESNTLFGYGNYFRYLPTSIYTPVTHDEARDANYKTKQEKGNYQVVIYTDTMRNIGVPRSKTIKIPPDNYTSTNLIYTINNEIEKALVTLIGELGHILDEVTPDRQAVHLKIVGKKAVLNVSKTFLDQLKFQIKFHPSLAVLLGFKSGWIPVDNQNLLVDKHRELSAANRLDVNRNNMKNLSVFSDIGDTPLLRAIPINRPNGQILPAFFTPLTYIKISKKDIKTIKIWFQEPMLDKPIKFNKNSYVKLQFIQQ